ncbi:cation diffusion facilitator family transporter [Romboutsia lituseburensis]|uniref:Cation diffusion facilitator family transporter n=1 Tax=Romboutsia lituseburensis DSM 797 TaxID=1121325 RepID=A0A1G9TG58_9FIRM|nr:cation diffusion facilitator family transporter [Romboutsia lituseburensis]CEH36209.1 Cation efflux protein [Romboutsia lituseburensis]SDM46660.1 cation diffusion facilitator family transporter [Romboutsia lituseburensis DSM 797]
MENTNYKKVKQVLLIILFANLGVALLKIIIGNSIKSASMTADGFHSISDGTSNIVGLIGIALASKPIDKEHPYGHNKFEVISGLFIGGMLLFLGFKIIIDAVTRFKNPVTPTITMVSLIVLIVTLLINVLVCTYEYRIGKKLNSYILVSDSLHTKSDIFVSIGVLMTLVGVKLGLPAIIDPIASLVVAGFILHASYEVFKSTIDVLVDTAIIDEDDIREVLKEFKTIKSVHKIRSRGSESNVHIDMHIMVDPNLTVEDSHVLNHDIEDLIQEKINKSAQVIVHTEPYYE